MRRFGFLLLVGLIVALGCGSKGPKLVPVEGKVSLKDGTPVIHGHITLHPDAAKGNTAKETVFGYIRNGSFTVNTGARPGAPAGAYKVSIEAAKEVDEKNPYFTEWLADERYVNPETSKLTLDAIENPEPGRYDFKLDPHPMQKAGKKK